MFASSRHHPGGRPVRNRSRRAGPGPFAAGGQRAAVGAAPGEPPDVARPPKAVVSWSTGKDAAYALHDVRRSGEVQVVGALTTLTDQSARVAAHGVREELLDLQIQALGLPCAKVRIPHPCPNDRYERAMGAALAGFRDAGVTHVVFGDLFLDDIRAYRQALLADLGMHAVFPLWERDTARLAAEMTDAGVLAVVACVNQRMLHRSFAGRVFDHALLAELPDGVDPCGENGEFHTFVTAGPMLRRTIDVRVAGCFQRERFVFADLAPAETAAPTARP